MKNIWKKIVGLFGRLKARWGIENNRDVILILLVFAIAGWCIIPFRHLIFWLFGYNQQTTLGLKIITWLVFVFPVYQLFLLILGFLFGQWRFFWEKEKGMVKWVWKRFKG